MTAATFELDDITNTVHRAGICVRLSEQEKRLLVLLNAHAGTACPKRTLMDALWGRRAEWMEDAAIVQLVSRLRRSLAPLGLARAIVTVARVGYRFDPPDEGDGVDDTTSRQHPDHLVERSAAVLPHCVAREGYGEVERRGIVVRVPLLEYRLLNALLSPPQAVHDKRTLIALLWPARPGQDDTNLMQVVSRLRRKLIPLELHDRIVTVPREGYRFAIPVPSEARRTWRPAAWWRATLAKLMSTLTARGGSCMPTSLRHRKRATTGPSPTHASSD